MKDLTGYKILIRAREVDDRRLTDEIQRLLYVQECSAIVDAPHDELMDTLEQNTYPLDNEEKAIVMSAYVKDEEIRDLFDQLDVRG